MIQCRNNGISFNPKKCVFCVNSRVLLEHIICEDGLLVDPREISIIVDMPTPTSVIKLKGFLGATCFNRQYFRNFAAKAA
jgi:hypothetical protein